MNFDSITSGLESLSNTVSGILKDYGVIKDTSQTTQQTQTQLAAANSSNKTLIYILAGLAVIAVIGFIISRR